VKALIWRETVLQGRNGRAQVYRYTQMVVLAIMLATVFLRGEVFNTDTIRVRDSGGFLRVRETYCFARKRVVCS
jgi:hypothetical protein